MGNANLELEPIGVISSVSFTCTRFFKAF